VLEPVIEEFGLFVGPGQPVGERQLNAMRQSVGLQIEGARTFHLTFANRDPEKAAQVVTRVVEQFLSDMGARRQDSAAVRVEVLEAESQRAEQEMLARYTAMENYEDQVTGTLGDDLTGYLASVARTNARLEANKSETTTAELARDQTLFEIGEYEQLLGYEPTQTSPVISSQRRALEAQLEQARDRYTDQHPEVQRIQAEIARLDDGTIDAVVPSTGPGGPTALEFRLIGLRVQLANADRRLEGLYEERQELLTAQEQYLAMADTIPRREEELTRLVRDHELARARYSDLLSRLYEARLAARLQPVGNTLEYTVVETARVPIDPVNPQRRRRVFLGLGLGITIGLALLLLAQQLDTSFTDVQDLSSFKNLPVLASIPSMPRGLFRRSKNKTPVPTLTDRSSIASEQFRILAVRLRDMIDREFSHVVLFTGSAGGEGKTTTVLNTAIALSQIQDERVLLIDADLRRPRVRLYLPADSEGLGADEGLRDLLKDKNTVSPEMFGRVGNLYVLAGTTGTSDSIDEIVSPDARKLISRLRKTFKYILIDSPPVLPMADSHLLAELSDRVVFVVRARRTRRETLARALEVFDPKNVLGLILNDVSYEHARYGQAYRHYEKQYLSKSRKVKARLRIL